MPIIPTVAAEIMSGGDRISISNGKATLDKNNGFAVVDPFLKKIVTTGQQFYALMVPGTVQNLRHEWAYGGISEEVMDKIAKDPEGENQRELERQLAELNAKNEELQEKIDDGDEGCRNCY